MHAKTARATYYSSLTPCLALISLILLTIVQDASTFLIDDAPPPPPLRVASFNIRHFGKSLMGKADVVENIVKILQRYDLVFIMETRDSSMTSLDQLQEKLGVDQWSYVASAPIGRTRYYREQYVYFYRPSVVNLLGTHQYNDSAKDVFEREPYLAQFQYWSQAAGSPANVTFVGAHLDPDHVPAEMEGLPAVVASAQLVFPNSGGVITMGDFNADCGYMSDVERASATLFKPPYTSFVPASWDTTVSTRTNCAYDRVVLAATQVQPAVKVDHVKAYNFHAELGLEFDEAWRLSDHYPIEFTLE